MYLPEALATSGDESSNNEHNHQWMDEKGWSHRTAYLQDRSGNIYEATLNIANGRNRRILYDITNIRKIDTKKEATGGAVSSTETGRDSHTNGNFGGSVTEKRKRVKGQFSISEDAAQPEAAPADIVSSLPTKARDYLERAERRLVSRLGGALSGESLPNGTSCSICC